jgi:glyoxylase-like metal-dependent hydrolase (beta-lactamase superfamily II)
MVINTVETPGHKSDHNSYLLNYEGAFDGFLGDTVLGTPSVSCDDMTQYMKDLKRISMMPVRDLYLTHTLDQKIDSIIVPAKTKIIDYI